MDPRERRRAQLAFLVVTGAVLMATIEGSAVNVALPTLASPDGLDVPPADAGWVPLIYSLVLAAGVLPAGRLGDLVGMRRVFVWGTGLFTAASLACAVAPSLPFLLVARGLQGLGSCFLSANALALVSMVFPRGERGKQLGRVGAAVGVGLVAGPSIGGALVEVFGWRSVFLLPLPIGLASLVFQMRVLPRDEPSGERFDLAGGVLSAVTIVLLALSAHNAPALRSGPSVFWLLPVGAVLGLLAFWIVQRRATSPLVDPALFSAPLTRALLSKMLSFVVFGLVPFVLPFYLEHHVGLTPGRVGLVMLTTPLMNLLVAPRAGRLADRIDPRIPSSVGLVMLSVGIGLLAGMAADWSPWDVVWRLAIIGTGGALFQSPNNVIVMGCVQPARFGTASALLAVMRSLGFALSLAVATSLLGRGVVVPLEQLQLAFHIGIAIGVVALLVELSAFVQRRPPPAPGGSSEPRPPDLDAGSPG